MKSKIELASLENVHFRRNNNQILSGINWKINSGENWVLLGKNGIGKSTLINILSARAFPTNGKVEIFGKQLGKTDVFSLRERIGVLGADSANLFPNALTARQVVVTALKGMTDIWGDSRDKIFREEDFEKAQNMLESFSVLSIADRAWGLLSQGERKRVQMARALVTDPDLLIFDEPTAGMDLAGREIVINILTRLSSLNRESGKDRAIVLVNHNVEEIPPSFDKIAIMGESSNSGTIQFQGDIKSTLTSQNLTKAYGIDLVVERQANLRYFASCSVVTTTL